MNAKINFIKLIIPFLFFSLLFSMGCNSQSTITNPVLTPREKQLCDSLKIDSSIILGIRTHTDSAIHVFPTNLEKVLDKDIDPIPSKFLSVGLLFNSSDKNTDDIVTKLYNDFKKKGYTIFSLDRNFGIGNKPDIVGVLKSVDQYKILKQVQTDGINWGIDNDSLLNLIKKFDEKYSLELIGASGDWCEFKINNEPKDWLAFAKEVYLVCPDVVDQGGVTVEKLASEMKQTRRLYFWWD